MYGIVCAFDLKQNAETLAGVKRDAKIIRHRGPDWSGIRNDKAILSHEFLVIVDPASGKQPLFSEDRKFVLAAMETNPVYENVIKMTDNFLVTK
jgi:asparagine synthase (glutamine-hydrolysing)